MQNPSNLPCENCGTALAQECKAHAETKRRLEDLQFEFSLSDLPDYCWVPEEGEALLKTIRQACKRLGDDPPYYEISAEDCGVLAQWQPDLPDAINAYLKSLPKRV